jgi:hypothetical protein
VKPFDVYFTHSDNGRIDSIVFEGADFSATSLAGRVRIWLDDEACMNEYRLFEAVGQERDSSTGDFETEPKEDERNTEAWLDKEG